MLKTGDIVPDCELIRFSDNSPVRLPELHREGPVALLFAKASCPTCQWAFPYLDRLGGRSGLKVGRVFFVLQESSETASLLLDQYQLKTAILLDPEPFPASEEFELRFVPNGALIGETGEILVQFESFDRGSLEEMAASLQRFEGVEQRPLFRADEGLPAFRPG